MTQRTGIFGAVFVLPFLFVGCGLGDASAGGESPDPQSGVSSTGSGGAGGDGGVIGAGGSGGATQGGGTDAGVACDPSEPCGDYSQGCTGCAVLGLCAEVYQACLVDDACLEFNKCVAACNDDVMCKQICRNSNMVGADRFNALVQCIVCDACPMSCADFTSICTN